MTSVIAILTDFGLEDTYVGVMKAVMLKICPSAQLIDITHGIQPQNVREAAFALLNSHHHFPPGTTFCVVVDPGVGSDRLPIAVKTADYTFLSPNNGVLSYALAIQAGDQQAVTLNNPSFHGPSISQTFHGRDIFAPASAHLALSPDQFPDLGDPLPQIDTFPVPELSFARHRLTGEVMHIDHFGNIITSIGTFRWENPSTLSLSAMWNQSIPPMSMSAADAHVSIHSHTVHGVSHAYHEMHLGTILAQIDSNGFLEISTNQDNAAARLDAQVGDKVMLRLSH